MERSTPPCLPSMSGCTKVKVVQMAETDSDLRWLRDYAPAKAAPPLQDGRVDQLNELLSNLIKLGRLPFTVGLFGGWGSGKTTFLSIMANRILTKEDNNYKVIYFNAWKYAGFMEIVPSLIYKVLRYGNHAARDPEEAIKEIMVSLGKEYSDTFGEWAKKTVGISPVELFKGASKVYSAIRKGVAAVPKDVIDAYYTQIDRAQDLLAHTFSDRGRVTIVLIDELDRCDPDEAFSVIKQLRIFFAMRDIPIAFIICANPEPIGLAIKHKYGLSTASGDYEARRILEKFVDVYVDMSEPIMLDSFVQWLWKDLKKDIGDYAFIYRLDAAYSNVHSPPHASTNDPSMDAVRNVTALQAMQTDNPLYGNLRLLRKTLERVCARTFSNSHMLWTAWHLELAQQMDPTFRHEIAVASSDIVFICTEAYKQVLTCPLEWRNGKFDAHDNPGGTLFGLYRSAFWDASRRRLEDIEKSQDPEARERARTLNHWMGNFRKIDFLIILSLIPIEDNNEVGNADSYKDLSVFLHSIENLESQFGYLLATY
jgi:hypothetical protein